MRLGTGTAMRSTDGEEFCRCDGEGDSWHVDSARDGVARLARALGEQGYKRQDYKRQGYKRQDYKRQEIIDKREQTRESGGPEGGERWGRRDGSWGPGVSRR